MSIYLKTSSALITVAVITLLNLSCVSAQENSQNINDSSNKNVVEASLSGKATPPRNGDSSVSDGIVNTADTTEAAAKMAGTKIEESSSSSALTSVSVDELAVNENTTVTTGITKTDLQQIIAINSYPASSIAKIEVTSFVDDKKKKTIQMSIQSQGNNALLEITAPRVDRGKFVLKADKDLWMYFSNIMRSIRVANRDNFLGTDASNYDLLEMNLARDYTIESFQPVAENNAIYQVTLLAKEGTEGYAQINSFVDIKNKVIVKNECYSISGEKIKVMNYTEHHMLADQRIPKVIEFTNELDKRRKSIMHVTEVTGVEKIDESIFSLGYLESL
ncbi:outer membrane lipoprotein-sorting protein [Aliikangiella maris]|uniref:Outer membrane lipoprotein-sorting protein n=2 Tax=Aliikangiella maris TaxID=3162458 RepID=A0ABV3MKZ8_9GAMM